MCAGQTLYVEVYLPGDLQIPDVQIGADVRIILIVYAGDGQRDTMSGFLQTLRQGQQRPYIAV